MKAYDDIELDFAKWRLEMYGTATKCDADTLSSEHFCDYEDED